MPSTFRGQRSRDAAPPTDDQLIAWYETGELLDRIARYFDLSEPNHFGETARRSAALAVAGKMDLIVIIEDGAVAALGSHEFFNVQQFYIEALPILEEPVSRMLAAVETLVKLGGADMAANLPNGALREWLRKDHARAEAIISTVGGCDAAANANLSFALEVVGDPARARSFLQSVDPLLKASALTALTRLSDPDPASRAKSIQAIGESLGDGADDMLCATAIDAVSAIASQDAVMPTDLVLAALDLALAHRGDGALNRAAQALWAYRVAVRSDIGAALLDALLDLNPAHKGTIDQLDMGLKAFIDAGQEREVLEFMAKLLIRHRDKLKANAFDSVWQEIVSGPPNRLSRWIVTWLISGEGALGSAVSEVLSHLQRDQVSLKVDRIALPTTPSELGYLARKTVGWFMLQPRLATSILVAILGVCDGVTAQNVAGLLAYPVLRNYPEVRETLDGLSADDPAKSWVQAALDESERYLVALRAMPYIPELTPPDQNRRIQYLFQKYQMRIAHKAAREQSIFFNLVRRSTLLYGVRSLNYPEDLNGARQPMEMALKTFEFSMTLPRLNTLDPIGLQLLLIRFRSEARPA